MSKGNPKKSVKLLTDKGVARAGEHQQVTLEVEGIPDIMKLLAEHNAVPLAVECLVKLLNSTVEHYDPGKEMIVLEVDGPTRVKAAQILLGYGIGEPVKRQQILTGKMPEGPVSKEQMKDVVDRKLWERINRPDVTTAELVAARRSLAEAEKADATNAGPLTEEQALTEARRIHGMSSVIDPTAPTQARIPAEGAPPAPAETPEPPQV